MNNQFPPDLQVRAPSPIELLRDRAERELLTDYYGATIRRRMIWPQRYVDFGATHPEHVNALREMIAGGDVAEIIGPAEVFTVLAGAPALVVLEALQGHEDARP